MSGLIRNNFYSMGSNLIISFIMATALALSPLLINNTSFYVMIIAVQIFLFVVNTGTALHADEVSKWNKFEMTLPIKRNTIVRAKYITFFVLILFGLFMGVCTVICANLAGQTWSVSSALWGFNYGLALSIISISLMYPVALKFGTEKNELFFLLSAFVAVAFMGVIALSLSPVTDGMNIQHPLVGAVSTIIAVFLFIMSYFASTIIHKKKEF